MVIKMYNIEEKYLYEILDDYKELENKEEIFNEFMYLIWHSKNSRQIFTKYIRFSMLPNLVETDEGKVFYEYLNIPYIASKTTTTNTDFVSLIRQKVNNIYNNMFEFRLCTRKDYMELLHMPKILYYRWEKDKNDDSVDNLRNKIIEGLAQADELKNQYSKQKMNLTWKQFKPVVAKYMRRAFENYIPLDEYENKNTFVLDTDLWTEDNFSIRYICNCLQHAIKDYQKEYYGLYRKGKRSKLQYQRCIKCGKLFLIKNSQNKYCDECQKYQPIEIKIIQCTDCGSDVEISSRDNETCRCDECRDIHLKIIKQIQNKRHYDKIK